MLRAGRRGLLCLRQLTLWPSTKWLQGLVSDEGAGCTASGLCLLAAFLLLQLCGIAVVCSLGVAGQREHEQLFAGVTRTLQRVQEVEDIFHDEVSERTERALIGEGYRLMREESVVFVARLQEDDPSSASREMALIEETGRAFARYAVLCLEEGASSVARDWSARNDAVRRLDVAGVATAKSGFGHAADVRNAYLAALRKSSFLGASFLVVLDSGPLEWDLGGVAHSFGLLARAREEQKRWPERPASEGANFGDRGFRLVSAGFWRAAGHRRYGDYARSRGVPWAAVCSSRQGEGGGPGEACRLELPWLAAGPRSPRAEPEVAEACFGGLAVYRVSALGGCAYGPEACEHAPLHRCLVRSGGLVVINPRQQVT